MVKVPSYLAKDVSIQLPEVQKLPSMKVQRKPPPAHAGYSAEHRRLETARATRHTRSTSTGHHRPLPRRHRAEGRTPSQAGRRHTHNKPHSGNKIKVASLTGQAGLMGSTPAELHKKG